MPQEQERERGTQPINELMLRHGLSNHALVAASTEQLTHKMVAKARVGRWLTPNVRLKVLRAFNTAAGTTLSPQDLFNY